MVVVKYTDIFNFAGTCHPISYTRLSYYKTNLLNAMVTKPLQGKIISCITVLSMLPGCYQNRVLSFDQELFTKYTVLGGWTSLLLQLQSSWNLTISLRKILSIVRCPLGVGITAFVRSIGQVS